LPNKCWIKKAKLKKGSLRRQVKQEFGGKGFTGRGTIKHAVLVKLSKRAGKTGRRAQLALTLRKV
jgi:hypothetical protein